jgi:glycosyltransferase involved in cell wall biosynthesis
MIEAMSLGVVPLSTTATAMNDYINQNNSIIIDYDAQLTKGAYHYLHNVLSTTHYPPKMSSIIDAIVFASKISSDKYERLSSQAKKEVYQKYSIQSFTEKLCAIGMIK